MRVPLDLIYLDEECRVIEVVESFPTFRVSSSSPRAAAFWRCRPTRSIRRRPNRAISWCSAWPKRCSAAWSGSPSAGGVSGEVQSAVLLRASRYGAAVRVLWRWEIAPRRTAGPIEPYEMDLDRAGDEGRQAAEELAGALVVSGSEKSSRHEEGSTGVVPGLAAYYWTGAAPSAHSIRDISSTGLYVVTEERWYPGTLILMTLQESDSGTQSMEQSISVHSRAVRWGNDGVGLQFIPHNTCGQRGRIPWWPGRTKGKLDRFLVTTSQGERLGDVAVYRSILALLWCDEQGTAA